MDKKKKNIILICLLMVILLILSILVFLSFKNNKKMDNLIIDNNVKNNEVTDSNSGSIGDNSNDSNIIDSNNDIKNDVNSENNYDDYQKEYTEEDIVSYFDNMDSEVSGSSNWDYVKEKFKGYFITVVDFIFYDKEINGYTFSDLTNKSKLKVISIALKIDSKIEEKIPSYKETISSTGSKIYTDVKERLVTLYMNISTKMCENNSNECAVAKEIFSDVKSVCKIGWNFIKSLTSSGFSKLKEWYEIYSGK